MPDRAAEEMQYFHVPQTVGLIQKKFSLLRAKLKFKPICSCTRFLYTGSWLQGKPEWQWDGVTQSPCQAQSCGAACPGGHRAVQLAQEGSLKAAAWGTALTWKFAALGMWLIPHRPFSLCCPHLCLSSTS